MRALVCLHVECACKHLAASLVRAAVDARLARVRPALLPRSGEPPRFRGRWIRAGAANGRWRGSRRRRRWLVEPLTVLLLRQVIVLLLDVGTTVMLGGATRAVRRRRQRPVDGRCGRRLHRRRRRQRVPGRGVALRGGRCGGRGRRCGRRRRHRRHGWGARRRRRRRRRRRDGRRGGAHQVARLAQEVHGARQRRRRERAGGGGWTGGTVRVRGGGGSAVAAPGAGALCIDAPQPRRVETVSWRWGGFWGTKITVGVGLIHRGSGLNRASRAAAAGSVDAASEARLFGEGRAWNGSDPPPPCNGARMCPAQEADGSLSLPSAAAHERVRGRRAPALQLGTFESSARGVVSQVNFGRGAGGPVTAASSIWHRAAERHVHARGRAESCQRSLHSPPRSRG